MPLLVFWCAVAAAVLIVSFVVHVSTFLGFNPMAKWPHVMFMHLAIFPPFAAALCYADRAGGPKEGRQKRTISAAPLWLEILAGMLFAYGIMNFVIYLSLTGGGGAPENRDGKYYLTAHSRILRELNEEEYHQQQAYKVRGPSGHWIMFSSIALVMLVGAARLRRESAGARRRTRG